MCSPSVQEMYQDYGMNDTTIICSDGGRIKTDAILLIQASTFLKMILTEDKCCSESQTISIEYPKATVQYMLQLFKTGEVNYICKTDFEMLKKILNEMGIRNITVNNIHSNHDINSFLDHFIKDEVLSRNKQGTSKAQCEICQLEFTSIPFLQQHVKLQHIKICPVCNTRIFYVNAQIHYKCHVNRSTVETALQKLDLHECKLCFKRFSLFSSLERHYKKSHDTSIYVCTVCCNVFTMQKTYDEHICAHRCSKCGSDLVRNTKHRLVCPWIAEFPTACEICGAFFKTKFSLVTHLQRYLI